MLIKPKLLVTGLSGLIGSRLRQVAESRYELIDLSRGNGVDITDRKALDAALAEHTDVAALIHLAAYTDVSRAYSQTDDKSGPCYQTNVIGTQNLVQLCNAHKIHLVYVSTDFVFDGTKMSAYTEADLPKPIEWYGRTKLMGEEAVSRSLAWTIARIAFPYVAGPSPKADLVRGIYRKLAEGGEVNLFNDQIITPTFADDIAQGLLLMARVRPRGELFHLVGSSSLTPFDLGLKIARAFRYEQSSVRPGSMEEYLKKDARPRQRRLRISNAKWTAFATLHGLHPPLTIDDGLARVVREQPLPQSAINRDRLNEE